MTKFVYLELDRAAAFHIAKALLHYRATASPKGVMEWTDQERATTNVANLLNNFDSMLEDVDTLTFHNR